MYALVDCNSFYASCEKIFRPDLRDRPVVVLSNNDGCVIAATRDAKALGLTMGVPYFQARPLIKRHGVTVFSSNYALYGDISRRVMRLLATYARRAEVYSIDEAFLELEEMPAEKAEAFGDELAARVLKWIGMPVCVGLGPTKTLAKAANRTAKNRGVRSCKLEHPAEIDRVLADMPLGEVWGVSHRWGKKLNRLGVATALELKRFDPLRARKLFSIVMERTVRELRGEPCIEFEESPPPKKQIVVSRSFGQLVTRRQDLDEAVATYAARLGEKLRRQNSFANGLYVWVNTNRFREQDRQYACGCAVPLVPATAATGHLIAAARAGLARIFRDGYLYKKAGVMALDLTDADADLGQGNLFFDKAGREKQLRIMKMLDAANSRFGAGTIFHAAQGVGGDWKMQRNMMSPLYTTRWSDLPRAQ